MWLNSSENIFGGKFVFLGQFAPNVPISSMTFSGMDGDQERVYGLSFVWLNPITGARKLKFMPVGATPPGNSTMRVHEFEAIAGVSTEVSDPDFAIASLVADATDTFVQGAAFAHGTTEGQVGPPLGRVMESKGYAQDSLPTVGVRRIHFDRSGFWDEVDVVWNSLTIETEPVANAIGAGSDFRLYKVA